MDLSERTRPQRRRHPWESARLGFFLRVLRDHGLLRARRVLDLGAGDAWFARELRGRLDSCPEIVCCDPAYSPAAIRELAEAGLRLCTAVPDETFDLVLLLDVLEHVPEDRAFLEETIVRNVATGGHVLVSVPAWPYLFGAHDERLGHHRRYAPAAIRALVDAAGLRLVAGGGLFASLLLPKLLERWAGRGLGAAPHGTAGDWAGGPLLTSLVHGALAADARACGIAARAGVEIPGLSWWGLCARA